MSNKLGKVSTTVELVAALVIFIGATAAFSARMPVYIAIFPAAFTTIVILMFFG